MRPGLRFDFILSIFSACILLANNSIRMFSRRNSWGSPLIINLLFEVSRFFPRNSFEVFTFSCSLSSSSLFRLAIPSLWKRSCSRDFAGWTLYLIIAAQKICLGSLKGRSWHIKILRVHLGTDFSHLRSLSTKFRKEDFSLFYQILN